MFVIYCHTSPSGKTYVGQTRCKQGKTPEEAMRRRWQHHVHEAVKGRVRIGAFWAAIRKYGADSFTHLILETCSTVCESNAAETAWIIRLDTLSPKGYNLVPGGGNMIHHPETIRRMSSAVSSEKRRSTGLLVASRKPRDEYSAASKKSWAESGEARRAISRANIAKMTREQLREAGLKGQAALTLDQKETFGGARSLQLANQTPEHRSEISKKAFAKAKDALRAGHAAITLGRWQEAVAKRLESQTSAQRRAAALKAWETKRARALLELDEQ